MIGEHLASAAGTAAHSISVVVTPDTSQSRQTHQVAPSYSYRRFRRRVKTGGGAGEILPELSPETGRLLQM
jgi:hypothetical protein